MYYYLKSILYSTYNKAFEIDFEIQNLLLFLPDLSFDTIFKFNYYVEGNLMFQYRRVL